MTVVPDVPLVRKFLTLKYREMQKANGQTTFKNLEAPMYSEGTTVVGALPCLYSHQGLWRSLYDYLLEKGHKVQLIDKRRPFPSYDLSKAMVCLKEYQKVWIVDALLAETSGLIGAPTRFGKTYGMEAICRAFPDKKIVITAPGVDLCGQIYDHFMERMKHRNIHGVYTGSKNNVQSDGITICSVDSLEKMDPDDTDILIIDEPHAVVSEERLPQIARFTKSVKYGFGATLKGRFDKKDRLIEAIIGPVLSNVTYKEAVAMGAIAPLKVAIIEIPFSKDSVPGRRVDRQVVYKRLLTQSKKVADIVKKTMEEAIPPDWQTMAFIVDEKQADYFMQEAMPPHGTVAMAKKLTPSERKKLTKAIAAGTYQRVLASNIYVQGVTFPDLKVVLNLAGGGANTTAIQKPGRLLQTRPGKNYGVMVDFLFKCRDEALEERHQPPWRCITGECWARMNAYEEIGYDIVRIRTCEELKELIAGSYS